MSSGQVLSMTSHVLSGGQSLLYGVCPDLLPSHLAKVSSGSTSDGIDAHF